ncbi:MAG: TonB-dependent receptor plug domain-containing protein, partial [Verrucomicrobiae bacterium]|nr:TonB-dependent receptor plug domain-containing protein [Verrucomicrobiae bacterium]
MTRMRMTFVALATSTMMTMAESNPQPITRLPELEVVGTPPTVTPWTLPPVEGTKIYESKKSTVVDLTAQPPVINQTHRQATAHVPGLLISESSGPTHLNQNYRGIGDPHESEFVLTLKDGVPIVSDWFGYSTVYFAPPLEAIQRVEFLRGGAALLYGPQPGPVLNYVTKDPPADVPFRLSSQNVFGSDSLYGGFHWAGGTVDQFGYLAAYSRLQGDGPRRNADYESDWGLLKLTWQADDATRWVFTFDGGAKDVGEPGRLSLAQYRANRDLTRTPFDRIFIERYMPVLS